MGADDKRMDFEIALFFDVDRNRCAARLQNKPGIGDAVDDADAKPPSLTLHRQFREVST